MHKLTRWALLALAGFGLSAYGVEATNAWWNVEFEPTNGVQFVDGTLIGFTNQNSIANPNVAPWPEGFWTALDGDESYVTNSYNGTNTWKEFGYTTCIKLDTQGNDLTWTVGETNQMATGLKALVDADLYLVGSDSAPDAGDFDSAGDVQTAIYLKNETDDGTGETTNSVLCVYAYDSNQGVKYWQELDGVELEDNAWVHVQVLVDFADEDEQYPPVKVYVNGTEMHARDKAPTDRYYARWLVASTSKAKEDGKVSSVAFRGTGAIDNFVGRTLQPSNEEAFFKAEVYMDGRHDATQDQTTDKKYKTSGSTKAEFPGLFFDDYLQTGTAHYALDRIEIDNFETDTTTVYRYDYDKDNEVTPLDILNPTEDIVFELDPFDNITQTGEFTVKALTTGAPGSADETVDITNTIVRIYFKTLGAKEAYATTDIGGVLSTNTVVVKPADCPTNLVWTFPAVQGGAILSTVQVYEGAAFSYANGTATVSTNLEVALAADTLFVAATYTNGTLGANQTLQPDAGVNGLYTFAVVEGGEEPEHEGAKSTEGFIILVPTDVAANNRQLEFTDFDPAAGAGSATATISAAMLNPGNATSVTLQLIYRTSLTGQDQYVNATISDIDTANGTATVTFQLPQEDTLFLMGFRNQTGVQ